MTDSNILNENSTVAADEVKVTETQKEVKTETNNSNENNGNKEETKPTETVASGNDKEESKVTEEETVVDDPRNDEMNLDYLDKDFVYECMAVPTHSKMEWRLVEFVILWARRNKIKYEFDDFGNVYLTKGELKEGEFYPCVTSHLDSVQDKHDPYIYAGVPLDLKTKRTKDDTHEISVDSYDGASIGIGADDKGGVCICLSMFKHLDKLKACFFLDEETGCHGSDHLWEDWFKDVGYVIGYDSPELYRAAWACSGTKLFSYEFYTKYMKPVCDVWGLTKGCFFSEPYTDVKNIRKKTEVMCMNFGNGGYNPHSATEYFIIEDMDMACGMGVALVNHIGLTRHTMKDVSSYGTSNVHTYRRDANGIYLEDSADDTELLRGLGDNTRSGYYGYGAANRGGSTTTTTTTTTTVKKDEEIKLETVKYIVSRYDTHIEGIKNDVLEGIKVLCESQNIDFTKFESVIKDKFNNEIKF